MRAVIDEYARASVAHAMAIHVAIGAGFVPPKKAPLVQHTQERLDKASAAVDEALATQEGLKS